MKRKKFLKIKGKWDIQNIQEKVTNNANKEDPTYREHEFLKKKIKRREQILKIIIQENFSWNKRDLKLYVERA